MLTDKYLDGIPEGSRATRGYALSHDLLAPETLEKIRALNEIAEGRGQTLAQMALAWTLRDPRDLHAHRRVERRPARGERRRARPARFRRGRPRRDRPSRNGERINLWAEQSAK